MEIILNGDCLSLLRQTPGQSINCCVTSPPYFGLRDYGHKGQIGLEDTPEAFVARLVEVFREVRRVLRDDGTLWLNLGDSYNTQPPGNKIPSGFSQTRPSRVSQNGDQETVKTGRQLIEGLKKKDLIGIPWMLAFALRADGWYLRQDIIWHKPNPMPESVRDRCTKAHEYIFLLSKSERYFFDSDSMKEPVVTSERDIKRARVTGRGGQASSANYLGSPQRDKSGGFPQADPNNPVRNRRSVWTVATRPYKGAHFATFPPDLIRPCVIAGCPVGGIVLDPFSGAGTTGVVCKQLGRNYLGYELNPEYVEMSKKRIEETQA